jgi:hypothetical protein
MANKQLSKEELFKRIVLEIDVQRIFVDIPIQNHFKGNPINEKLDFLNDSAEGLNKKNFDYHYWNKYLETIEEVKQAKSINHAITKLKVLIFHFNEMAKKDFLVSDKSYYDAEHNLHVVNFGVSNSKVSEWISSNVTSQLTENVRKLEELRAIFADEPVEELMLTPTETFESFLTTRGKKLLPKIKDTYSNSKPKQISILVLALEKDKRLVKGALSNLRPFHSALIKELPGIGVYENLRSWIKEKYDSPDVIAAVDRLLAKWKNL